MSEEDARTEQPTASTAKDAAQEAMWPDSEFRAAVNEMIALSGARGPDDEYDYEQLVEEAPIVRLANTILQSAIKEKASDILIEPNRRTISVRFRIDGLLHEVMQMPEYIKAPLTQRYKILADVNILECRLPQKGVMSAYYAGNEYNFRCNTLPTQYGEKIVIHVSEASAAKMYLNQIGLTPEMQTGVENLLFRQRGLMVIAAGNGQGKTTTQYTLLNGMNTADRSIFAVAPDYDYTLPGITQAQLNPRSSYTAEVALASIADLGAEIVALDRCRAKEAIQLALSMAAANVLVLQTLTVSSTLAALRHLTDSADRGLVAEGLSGILAQMLVRRVCTNCREYYYVPASDLRGFGYPTSDPYEKVKLTRGKGCEACRNTGYKGRVGLFELMTMNAEMAEMVVRRAPLTDLKEAAKANGMKELREDGLIKMLQGITTPEEVLRAVPIPR